jgi:hypothetical protein
MGRVGDPSDGESGRVGEGESGRVGEWEIRTSSFLLLIKD